MIEDWVRRSSEWIQGADQPPEKRVSVRASRKARLLAAGFAVVIAVVSNVLYVSRFPAGVPPSTEDPRGTIVYNADLAPQAAPRPDRPKRPVLPAGVDVTLKFGIGTPWNTATTVSGQVRPSPRIVQSPIDVPLTVVVACKFCEETTKPLIADLVYRPNRRESNVVSFTFKPLRLNTPAYDSLLELSIFNDATSELYDRLLIEVTVSAEDRAEALVQTTTTFERAQQRAGEASPTTDATLHVIEHNGMLAIKVTPHSAKLKEALGGLVTDAEGRVRYFSSADQKEMQGVTSGAFSLLSRMSLQGDLNGRLARGRNTALVSEKSRESLLLTERETRDVSTVIANFGRALHRRLFPEGTELHKIIGILEEAADAAPADRPLRLQIVSNRVTLPWQYLHPVGEVEPRKFWGLRFSLNVHRVNNGAPAGLPTTNASGRKVIFARHGSASDKTVGLAEEQIAELNRLPVADLLVVKSSTQFLKTALTQEREKISAILAFTHASAGRTLQAVGNNKTVILEDADGPLLYFGTSDLVLSSDLDHLLNDGGERRYLASSPLVILNACESGPSTVHVPYTSLLDAMFSLGAQGVVVTEVSVWIPLGHAVGMRLIAKLGKGQTASDALTIIRRELYNEKRNPLGVLYAYYGDPTAVLRR